MAQGALRTMTGVALGPQVSGAPTSVDRRTVFGTGEAASVLRARALAAPSGVAGEQMERGQVVYSSPDGGILKAIASDLSTCGVIGLADFGRVTTLPGVIQEGQVVPFIGCGYFFMVGWFDATEEGEAELEIGATYWLSDETQGLLTKTPPSTPGNYRVKIGVAFEASTLIVQIGPPILIT